MAEMKFGRMIESFQSETRMTPRFVRDVRKSGALAYVNIDGNAEPEMEPVLSPRELFERDMALRSRRLALSILIRAGILFFVLLVCTRLGVSRPAWMLDIVPVLLTAVWALWVAFDIVRFVRFTFAKYPEDPKYQSDQPFR